MSRSAEQSCKSSDAPVADPVASARAAGLRYVTDAGPGIRRKRAGKGFAYIGVDGRPVRDREVLGRIKALAIPPAWTDVWICPLANGHLQATGRDAKGRKQYRYHPRWREARDETKYGRMIAFAETLPKIRERVERDLQLSGLPREKVLATVVRLLETTFIRVGNEEYARANGSIGLTTMRNKHVEVEGSTLRFRFRGKSGIRHAVDLNDRRLAKIIKSCRDLPGYELFQYIDDTGESQAICSDEVNAYLREIAGDDFTAKDFRTWAGTVLAAVALREFEEFESETQAKKNVVQAVESVAAQLGNTPAVCRKCYVHPDVIEAYLDGSLAGALRGVEPQPVTSPYELRPEEAAVLRLLKKRQADAERAGQAAA
ncbi:MAG TPA: DNA topoisomerase IB [Blastocatellia bacterium]|nr:DNA topoisomerase IB [Blastocatellia bacterium]